MHRSQAGAAHFDNHEKPTGPVEISMFMVLSALIDALRQSRELVTTAMTYMRPEVAVLFRKQAETVFANTDRVLAACSNLR